MAYVGASSWEESRALNPEYPCCTFRGSVTALRVRDGSVVWKTYTIPRASERTGKTPSGVETWGPSGVGIWSTPTLDLKRRRLYVTTGNNYSSPVTATSDSMMALDLDTRPHALVEAGAPRRCVQLGVFDANRKDRRARKGADRTTTSDRRRFSSRRRADASCCWRDRNPAIVWAIDPDKNGEVMWETRVAQGGINGGVQWGMAADGEQVYAATSDVVVIRTPTARQLDPQ